MRKVTAIALCVILSLSMLLTACGEPSTPTPTPTEKPKIELSVSDKEVTASFAKRYEVPTAECKSLVDKKKLQVVITAKDAGGGAVPVEDGYLKPTKLGKHTVYYNATDKDEAKTKADEVTFSVTFTDQGAIVEAKSNISKYTTINQYTNYAIPEFDTVATVTYDLKNWTTADFDVVKTATYTPYGSQTAEEIDITKASRYDIGSIEVTYNLTAKQDSTQKATHKLDVQVGDVLFNEFIDRGSVDGKGEISKVEVPDLKPEGYALKMSVPWDNNGWVGMKLMGPSDIFNALNSKTDQSLVLNCYNPTPYWGKFYFAVYDDADYEGTKGNFGNKYIIAPYEHFQMVIPKNMHKGKLTIFDISLENWKWEGAPLAEGELHDRNGTNKKFYATEILILSSGIVQDSDCTTQVWEDKDIPVLKAYTNQAEHVEKTTTQISKYDDAASGLKGIKVNNTVAENTYVDFLSGDVDSQKLINDKFAKARVPKYANFFAYTVTNLKDTAVPIWVMLGNGTNNQQTDTGTQWLYKLIVPANGSINVHMGASSREDAGHRVDYDVVRMNTDVVCELVISNVRIINYPVWDGTPTEKFTITEKTGLESYKAIKTGEEYTLPSASDIFEFSHGATATISKLYKKATVDGQPTEVAVPENATFSSFDVGYYTIEYAVKETLTNKNYVAKFDFSVLSDFIPVEKTGIDSYKSTDYLSTYTIPAFDTLFDCLAAHTATVQDVKFSETRLTDPSTQGTSIDSLPTTLTGRIGFYYIQYHVVKTANTNETLDKWFEVGSHGLMSAGQFVKDGTDYEYMGSNVILSNGKLAYKAVVSGKDWRGATTIANSQLVTKMNSLAIGEGIRFKIKNMSDTNAVKVRFYYNNNQEHMYSQKLELAAGAEASYFFAKTNEAITRFDYWIDASNEALTGGEIAFYDFEVVKESDVAVNIFDLSNATSGNAIAAAAVNPEGCTTVYDATKKALVITATGDKNISLLEADTAGILNKYYMKAGVARKDQVIAIDVTLISGKTGLWFGIGVDKNMVESGRKTVLEVGVTKTIYLTYGAFGDSGFWGGNGQTASDFAYFKPNLEDNSIAFSNFRILNFAGIE